MNIHILLQKKILPSDIIYAGNSSAELLLFLVLKQKMCEKHGKSQAGKKSSLIYDVGNCCDMHILFAFFITGLTADRYIWVFKRSCKNGCIDFFKF